MKKFRQVFVLASIATQVVVAQSGLTDHQLALKFITTLGGDVHGLRTVTGPFGPNFLGADVNWGKYSCGINGEGQRLVISTDRDARLEKGDLERTGQYLWPDETSAQTYVLHIGELLSPNHQCLLHSMQLTEDDLSGRHPKYARLDAKVSFTNDNYAWVDRTYGVEVHCDRQDGAVLYAFLHPNQPPVSEHARMELTLAQARERIHARWPQFDVSKFIYYLGWCKPREGDAKGVISYLFVRGTPHHPTVGSEIYYCEAIPNGRLWMSPARPTAGIRKRSGP